MANPFLYPNVTSLPGQQGVKPGDRAEPKRQEGVKTEFDQVFDETVGTPGSQPNQSAGLPRVQQRNLPEVLSDNLSEGPGNTDLSSIKSPLKFSAHASQRLMDRKITLDQNTMLKVNDAIDKAAAKGIDDTLILTQDAALIVSVKNRTVITAMDRASLSGNVFTNIDGAVII
ncbi:MAG: flagellar protein [Methylotenera sp.]|nr:flagellar protein [Oligoflexia bacterium]